MDRAARAGDAHQMTRILVVDDDPDVQFVVTTLLRDAGYEISVATNGLEALVELREHRPDAVLLDLGMAVMDGWGVLERIRGDATLRGVPVGVLSSSHEAPRARKESAVWAVVSKPFAADALLATVEGLVRHSTVRHNAIFWLSADGIVTNWNAGAEWMNGYAAAEIVGQPVACFYAPEDLEAGTPRRELSVAADEGCLQSEGWRVRKDGSRFLANVVITAMYDDQSVLSGFGIVTRDITEQRAFDARQGLLLEETAAANRELEAFSYSVSHDLRAPLRAIDGFSQALLEDHADQLDAGGQTYLHRVRAAGQRMEHLIGDLLQLSHLKDRSLQVTDVDLSQLAHEIAGLLDETAPVRRVVWTIEPAMIVRGDPYLLRIVLDNLLGNAFKFTSRTPSATIGFCADRSEGSAVYCVGDNGAGFDMAYADRLFGPFQRLHSADEFEGTGIGLATVHWILNRHQGAIRAESTPGAGATFRFSVGRPELRDPAR